MDPVVWFALGTLTVVFFLSGFVLFALLWRRCQQQNARSRADVNFIFSKNRDDKVENLAEMVPLLDTEMGKLEEKAKEAAEGEGPLSDVMAILSLTTRVVKVLSEVSVTRASPKIYEVIAQSMFRVDTHFHELLEFTPVEANDLRVIEARALTLTTTVWSLNAAFTLHGFDQVKDVEAMVIKMYEHVDALRQQIPGYIGAAKNGEGEAEEHEDDEKTGSQSTEETTAETTPGDAPVDTVHISHFPAPPSIKVIAEVNDPPHDEDTPAPPPAADDDEGGASNETAVPSAPSIPSSPSKSDSAPNPVSNGSPDQTIPSHSSDPPKTETEDVTDPLSQGQS